VNAYDDDSLLARLRAADPAASLPPADPERVADLLEDVMGETTTRTTESRDTGARDRSPLTWLVAAAAVLLIMATGAFALVDRGHDTTATADQTVTSLAVPQTQGRCLIPNAAVLRLQTIAFHGTLTALAGGSATFRVDTWFTGGPTDVATVSASPEQLATFVGGADLTVGGHYLVAAHNGLVTGCGLSGPDSPARTALYHQAFGG
jgi:uncharacterized protein GlcG (DUF336 family)